MEIDRLSALPDELVLSILGDLYQHDTKEAAKTATLSKRWRFMCTKLVDRLSELPDELLVHILRRLYNTKEAAKTAILSKRWRFIWTKLPEIYFWSSEEEEIGMSSARIREALAAYRKGASLEYCCRLRLHLYYDDAFPDDLVALLDSAENSSVRDVDLNLEAVEHKRYPGRALPQALYSYPSLRKLYLWELNLAPPETTVQWGLMIELSLWYVDLPQQALDQIVSGCPLLIRLEVEACSGFNRLDVPGQRFHELHVGDICGSSPELLEISAPYMTSLKLFIDPKIKSLRLTDVSSVEQVDIYLSFLNEDKETDMFSNNKQLFQLLQRVTSLVLQDEFIQVLSNTRREKGGQLPQFRVQQLTIEVQQLTIEDDINTNNIADVLAILESSPFLDKLVIHDIYCSKNKNINWNPSAGAADLVCDLLHLKTVEILIYVEIPHQLFITLAQILLRRAPVLEEMVIKVKSNESDSEDGIELVKKFETLLTFPKSSHKAVVHTISVLY